MEAWDWWRVLNIAMCGSAVLLNVVKAAQLRLFQVFLPDSAVGFLAVLAWPVGYIIATIVAIYNDVPAGPWTAIMSVPILWTVIAGLMRSEHPKKEDW